jgi:hypothetical protein
MVTDSVEWNASIQYAIPALTLANFQLDAQNSLFIYLFIYNTFIKIKCIVHT